jgi:orotate phosphoribosyltransferase-like protein
MSMDKLTLVIGPAPNEIPYASLIERLMKERERINAILFSPPKKIKEKKEKKKREKKTISRAQAEELLKKLTLL